MKQKAGFIRDSLYQLSTAAEQITINLMASNSGKFIVSHDSINWLSGFPGFLPGNHSCGAKSDDSWYQGIVTPISGSWCCLLAEMSVLPHVASHPPKD